MHDYDVDLPLQRRLSMIVNPTENSYLERTSDDDESNRRVNGLRLSVSIMLELTLSPRHQWLPQLSQHYSSLFCTIIQTGMSFNKETEVAYQISKQKLLHEDYGLHILSISEQRSTCVRAPIA